jgi:hypothetical protein
LANELASALSCLATTTGKQIAMVGFVSPVITAQIVILSEAKNLTFLNVFWPRDVIASEARQSHTLTTRLNLYFSLLFSEIILKVNIKLTFS